jgi:anthranilate synthase component I
MIVPGLAGLRPCYRRVLGAPDPLDLFQRLYSRERYGFLYESREEHGGRGRFSFLGARPLATFRAKDQRIRVDHDLGTGVATGRPLDALRAFLGSGVESLPVATFPGGAVGYLAYDFVRTLAPVGAGPPDDLGLPDAYFVLPGEVLIVDHLDQVVHLLRYGDAGARSRLDALAEACARSEGQDPSIAPAPHETIGPVRSNLDRPAFALSVERARRHIFDGDAYQIVLSRRFEFDARVNPLRLYAAQRETNPSPYLYYLALDGLYFAGSSPEALVRLTGRRVVARPLAGTRPRGTTPEDDLRLERELRADPKERAEHVMLVDLARNDLGRVCRTGTVGVDTAFAIERYARVMHLVSGVHGTLADDRDAFDVLAATFPAGTVSGAPKLRAMQIIDELEPVRRGPYAGAIGYVSFHGDLDLCIAIRTTILHAGRGIVQVGAGIVADSVADLEFDETESKARAMLAAIERVSGVESRA